MEKRIRLALVGLGDMGSGHLYGFDRISECEITWVADPHESNLARALGILKNNKPQVCTDHDQLLLHSDDYDAVVISVPNYLHRDVALPFIAIGKPLFLEKPVASTLGQCNEIIQAAEERGVPVQIGLVYRYSNVYRRMAQEVKRGRLGDVTMMWCKEFRDPFPPRDWFYDESLSGGALVEKDCHHFDIFNWMIGAKPVRVFASGGQHVIRRGQDNLITNNYTHYAPRNITNSSIVDHAWVTIDYDNGSKAMLGLCMYLKPYNLTDEGLEIGLIGSNGAQMVAKKDKSIDISGGEDFTKEYIDLDVVSDSVDGGHTGSQKQRYAFLNTVRTGELPFADLNIGKEALLIALAAEKSIKEERYVYLHELI
ncbi:Gfo/Idh/MocA family protein [Cohnella endophytica]|uniref:Gfo/Idh/MocA family protein n=1 Tax=Cohnella endophytica TaxID=2419778 RepID=UPI001F48E72A|nr:Gfo/Idh/MocA family oxidoreductase [Cohnella endophytica]